MGGGAPVYRPVLDALGIETIVPDAADAETVDRIIFAELVDGVFTDASREIYNGVIARLAERGCDAVALACTEIPLLVRAEEAPLPTARFHAAARQGGAARGVERGMTQGVKKGSVPFFLPFS